MGPADNDAEEGEEEWGEEGDGEEEWEDEGEQGFGEV